MRVKRTTYAPMNGNDEMIKLSQEIKQIIRNLQGENGERGKASSRTNMLKLFKELKKESIAE